MVRTIFQPPFVGLKMSMLRRARDQLVVARLVFLALLPNGNHTREAGLRVDFLGDRLPL
jgi:hypothetical protein